MSAASSLRATAQRLTVDHHRSFASDGPVRTALRAHPCYDEGATAFLDPLELGDVHVFTDGSSLHYDYNAHLWRSHRGTITSFGGARTLRRTKGAWLPEPA